MSLSSNRAALFTELKKCVAHLVHRSLQAPSSPQVLRGVVMDECRQTLWKGLSFV